MDLEKITVEKYEYLLQRASTHSIFHEGWWLATVSKVKKFKVELWGVKEKDDYIAVLPVLIYKIGPLSIVRHYLTPYLGPIFSSGTLHGKRHSIISKVKKINSLFAEALNSYSLVVYYPFSPWHVDLQPYKWAGFRIGVHYTYIIDLAQSLEEIWAGMDKRRRNEIRKAMSLNPEVVEGDINSFLELNAITFRRQGVNYDLRALWRRLFEECSSRGQCKVWTAFVGGEPLASLFLVWDKKRAYYLGGGINENSKGLMSYLLWNAIKFSKEKGLNVFDFEGSDVPSIEQYFRQFGGEITPIYHITSKLAALVVS